MAALRAHLEFVKDERLFYYRKIWKAKMLNHVFLSLIWDG
jgi:hypothetical protein